MAEQAEIDYTRTHWGHNHTLRQVDPGILRGHVWHRTPVKVGDHMKWPTGYGTCTGEVTECKPMMDPPDMYLVVVKVIRRTVEAGLEVATGESP